MTSYGEQTRIFKRVEIECNDIKITGCQSDNKLITVRNTKKNLDSVKQIGISNISKRYAILENNTDIDPENELEPGSYLKYILILKKKGARLRRG